MTHERIAEAARETAEMVVEYEREEGCGRDDAFRTPADVEAYADRFGWLDEAEGDLSDLSDAEAGELDEFEALVTALVIEALFK